jgi:hypothetical protein
VPGGDPSDASQLYARHRLGMGVIHVDGWVGARTSLLRALAGGKIEALGVRPDDNQRVSIPAHEWIDLRIQQRGPHDEVGRADGSIAYRACPSSGDLTYCRLAEGRLWMICD